jgi:hypothetical protein
MKVFCTTRNINTFFLNFRFLLSNTSRRMGKLLNSKILMTLIILVGFMTVILTAEESEGEGEGRNHGNAILPCPEGQKYSVLQKRCFTPIQASGIVG